MSDYISRQAAIDAVDSETVSTNPEHFKSSEKFIKFMDDADIASFGKWEWANGFNIALVATKVKLKKLPSAQPQWIPCSERLPHGSCSDLVIVSIHDDSGDTPYDYTSCGWITTDGEYWIVDNEINNHVVAWMPLPEPYRGESDEVK